MPRSYKRVRASESKLIHHLWELHQQCVKEAWTQQSFQQFIQLNSVTCYAVLDDKLPIAGAIVQQVAEEADLIAIFVKLPYRRQGIARTLMQRLQKSHPRLRRIHLEVRASNLPAIELYQSQGFTQTSERIAYYNDGTNALFMTKRLASD